jgi:uncharacterized protein YndB with AHSA1/START domain
MIDIVRETQATEREVRRVRLGETQGWSVQLSRTLDAPIDDVWDAVTNPDRIGRWFLPISGDYRVGGAYQFEGNAGGTIVACERPTRLRVTWVYGEVGDAPPSELEIRLTPAGEDRTAFVLEHVAVVPEEMWAEYGPGAVGVGWDGAVLGLALHLKGGTVGDPIAWQLSAEGRAFATRNSEKWGEAYRAAGGDADAVARAVANTTAFYAPEPSAS